ncbi:hypothetical protein AAFF_G00269920 [Aldrovandia affinis]|uniref:Uncharacterized protein n=1 Tax=Aldrovandia affinis TaxID=143900 RepID=A0AAD7SSN1_9TELE|nr:hypothetical protein AAFF_G00269920 [Aldrovandia affinis]
MSVTVKPAALFLALMQFFEHPSSGPGTGGIPSGPGQGAQGSVIAPNVNHVAGGGSASSPGSWLLMIVGSGRGGTARGIVRARGTVCFLHRPARARRRGASLRLSGMVTILLPPVKRASGLFPCDHILYTAAALPVPYHSEPDHESVLISSACLVIAWSVVTLHFSGSWTACKAQDTVLRSQPPHLTAGKARASPIDNNKWTVKLEEHTLRNGLRGQSLKVKTAGWNNSTGLKTLSPLEVFAPAGRHRGTLWEPFRASQTARMDLLLRPPKMNRIPLEGNEASLS